MWRSGKKWLTGLLLLSLLLVVSLPLFSEAVVMTAADLQEWEEILKEDEQLNVRDRLLNAKEKADLIIERKQFDQDKIDFQKEKKLNATERTLLNENEVYWNGLKTDLKSEYSRGYLAGFLSGLSIGFVVGETTGIYIGFKFLFP